VHIINKFKQELQETFSNNTNIGELLTLSTLNACGATLRSIKLSIPVKNILRNISQLHISNISPLKAFNIKFSEETIQDFSKSVNNIISETANIDELIIYLVLMIHVGFILYWFKLGEEIIKAVGKLTEGVVGGEKGSVSDCSIISGIMIFSGFLIYLFTKEMILMVSNEYRHMAEIALEAIRTIIDIILLSVLALDDILELFNKVFDWFANKP